MTPIEALEKEIKNLSDEIVLHRTYLEYSKTKDPQQLMSLINSNIDQINELDKAIEILRGKANLVKYEVIDFTTLNVGDKVYHTVGGNGVIAKIDLSLKLPVRVNFKNGSQNFLASGKPYDYSMFFSDSNLYLSKDHYNSFVKNEMYLYQDVLDKMKTIDDNHLKQFIINKPIRKSYFKRLFS